MVALMNALLLCALVCTRYAEAGQASRYLWPDEALPVRWTMSDYWEDSLSNATSWGYANAIDYQAAMMQDAFGNWYAGECTAIGDSYGGIVAGNEGSSYDLINKVYWDDPLGRYGTGVLAVTTLRPSAEVLSEEGGVYHYALDDVDITFNDGIDWVLTEEVEADCANGAYAVEPVATRQVGQFWGVDTDYDDSSDDCETTGNDPVPEDLAELLALYGPYAGFGTEDERSGALPLDICFQLSVVEHAELSEVEWSFGDDAGSSELNPCHSYTEQGEYTVAVAIFDEAGFCGAGDFELRQPAYVLACAPPGPGLSPFGEPYGGLFTYEHEEGLVYQLVNRTDTSVSACLDTVVWQVYDEGGSLLQELSAWSPEIELPEEGRYRVLLNVGGPGGMSAGELFIDTRQHRCSAAPVRAGLLALLGSLVLALGRRRRWAPGVPRSGSWVTGDVEVGVRLEGGRGG